MNPVNKYKEDYLKCQTQEDYEQYFLKYSHHKDNPYLDKAKNHIYTKEKIKSEYSYGYLVLFLICFVVPGVIVVSYKEWNSAMIIIGSVCVSPFIIWSLYEIIKTTIVRYRNK